MTARAASGFFSPTRRCRSWLDTRIKRMNEIFCQTEQNASWLLSKEEYNEIVQHGHVLAQQGTR